ncbi:replication factor A3 [Kwoniella heveanensis CBS 569]|uniref:Replication factor A3 n=1 Tax=Kwoniella heveanensis BCC8398 TaxID=1296120 RepID=A0A1B9GWP9_9TREE|nr:replication factor A3 [Kwoniella heveanensis BCC8398]OCF41227.1 replication factor A3 [Kwoniella heveanensis CBS 569]
MSRLGPEPRINSKYIAHHRGENVRLTAKVVKISGDTITVETSDGGQLGVHINRDMHIEDGFVEIIGLVKEDLSIKAHTFIQLSKPIDMKAVNNVIEFAHSSKGQGVLA